MCGRVTQFSRHEELLRSLGAVAPAVAPRYNISPGTPLLCLRREQGAVKAEALAWGFIPAWAAPDSRDEGHANARAEGIFDRPTFRDAARLRRCLVPIDGYYEWKTEGRQKIPYYFRAADGGPLAVGGLWSLQVRPDGTMRRTLCLVTVEVHARMPVLLLGAQQASWLAEGAFAPADFAALAATAPDRSLAVHRVSPDVNRVACDDPRLIASSKVEITKTPPYWRSVYSASSKTSTRLTSSDSVSLIALTVVFTAYSIVPMNDRPPVTGAAPFFSSSERNEYSLKMLSSGLLPMTFCHWAATCWPTFGFAILTP